MRKSIRSFLKYSISFAIALFIFWYLYKDADFAEMFNRFTKVDFSWVILSILIGLFSHWVRAYRWNMLLQPLGYELKSSRTFLAVMIGYLVNFIVPRMGEVSRCGVLHKTDHVSLPNAFGSVVSERVIDTLCLLTATIAVFFIEIDVLRNFFIDLFEEKFSSAAQASKSFRTVLVLSGIVLSVLLLLAIILIRRYRKRIKKHPIFRKILDFMRNLVDGILTIRQLKSPFLFWGSTLILWLSYFLMSYVVVFGIAETSHLGLGAGLAMLIMGGLGMAAPVQGGIGAYHYLVSSALLLYGIDKESGIFFAFVLHSSQTFTVVITGLISFVLSMIIPKRNAKTYAD